MFIENTARQDMIAEGTEPPKKGDFIHWSEIIADKVAAGSTRQELRGYLKAIARSTWQLVSWLTHATNLGRYEGTAALDATYAVLNAFGAAVLGVERPITDRCGRCGSVRSKPSIDLNLIPTPLNDNACLPTNKFQISVKRGVNAIQSARGTMSADKSLRVAQCFFDNIGRNGQGGRSNVSDILLQIEANGDEANGILNLV